MLLDAKVVLITGATGGLGHAVTPAFLNTGARVITVGRHAGSRPAENQRAFAADVTDEAGVRRVVADVIREAGHLSVAEDAFPQCDVGVLPLQGGSSTYDGATFRTDPAHRCARRP